MKAPTDVQSLLAIYPPQVQVLAYQLRKLVTDAFPRSAEMIDTSAKVIGYGFGAGYKDLMCTIMPSKVGVNPGLFGERVSPTPGCCWRAVARFTATSSSRT